MKLLLTTIWYTFFMCNSNILILKNYIFANDYEKTLPKYWDYNNNNDGEHLKWRDYWVSWNLWVVLLYVHEPKISSHFSDDQFSIHLGTIFIWFLSFLRRSQYIYVLIFSVYKKIHLVCCIVCNKGATVMYVGKIDVVAEESLAGMRWCFTSVSIYRINISLHIYILNYYLYMWN